MISTRTDDDFWINEATIDNDIYDRSIPTEKHTSIIKDVLGTYIPNKKPTILEIGSGTGRLTTEMQRLYPNSLVYGIDINPVFINEAEKAKGKNTLWPKYINADSISLSNIDFIYSVAVFQHIDSQAKREYIRQAAGALSKQGVMLLQYVEGTHASRAMYDATINDMAVWCREFGLKIINESFDLICPRWTWITVARV